MKSLSVWILLGLFVAASLYALLTEPTTRTNEENREIVLDWDVETVTAIRLETDDHTVEMTPLVRDDERPSLKVVFTKQPEPVEALEADDAEDPGDESGDAAAVEEIPPLEESQESPESDDAAEDTGTDGKSEEDTAEAPADEVAEPAEPEVSTFVANLSGSRAFVELAEFNVVRLGDLADADKERYGFNDDSGSLVIQREGSSRAFSLGNVYFKDSQIYILDVNQTVMYSAGLSDMGLRSLLRSPENYEIRSVIGPIERTDVLKMEISAAGQGSSSFERVLDGATVAEWKKLSGDAKDDTDLVVSIYDTLLRLQPQDYMAFASDPGYDTTLSDRGLNEPSYSIRLLDEDDNEMTQVSIVHNEETGQLVVTSSRLGAIATIDDGNVQASQILEDLKVLLNQVSA